METIGRGAIDSPERSTLTRRDREDAGAGIRREHDPFELCVVSVAGRQSVEPRTLDPRLVLETRVGRIVDVETRHLVHADYEVDGVGRDMIGDPAREAALADMAADATRRQNDALDARQVGALPFQGVDSHLVSPLTAARRDLHQIPGGTPMGEELEDRERDVHWAGGLYDPASCRR